LELGGVVESTRRRIVEFGMIAFGHRREDFASSSRRRDGVFTEFLGVAKAPARPGKDERAGPDLFFWSPRGVGLTGARAAAPHSSLPRAPALPCLLPPPACSAAEPLSARRRLLGPARPFLPAAPAPRGRAWPAPPPPASFPPLREPSPCDGRPCGHSPGRPPPWP
jgi:hypothetical protein